MLQNWYILHKFTGGLYGSTPSLLVLIFFLSGEKLFRLLTSGALSVTVAYLI
jgi:hypothetical protein